MREASSIPRYVQDMVAGTNGRMYLDVVGKLSSYPIPELPFPGEGKGLFLEIGCGWGRWLVAAARRGYHPVGIDLKWDAARAVSEVLAGHGLTGSVVVCELDRLPFKNGCFAMVWSYSVLQHVDRRKALNCIEQAFQTLAVGGRCIMEFPLRTGLRNRFLGAAQAKTEPETSWCVRYYELDELKRIFMKVFGNFRYESHCFFGIGIQAIDFRYVAWRHKPVILISLLLAWVSKFLIPLRRLSDSVYVLTVKQGSAADAVMSAIGRRWEG